MCVAIKPTYSGILHGLQNELVPPPASDVPVFADHSNNLQLDDSHAVHEQAQALHELHEQHFVLKAPEIPSAPSFTVQPVPAISEHHSQPAVAVHHAQPTPDVQHAQPAVIHQGPQALSPFGDAVLQGHTVNGQLVNEQVINGHFENGALISQSQGPVHIVRVC